MDCTVNNCCILLMLLIVLMLLLLCNFLWSWVFIAWCIR